MLFSPPRKSDDFNGLTINQIRPQHREQVVAKAQMAKDGEKRKVLCVKQMVSKEYVQNMI